MQYHEIQMTHIKSSSGFILPPAKKWHKPLRQQNTAVVSTILQQMRQHVSQRATINHPTWHQWVDKAPLNDVLAK